MSSGRTDNVTPSGGSPAGAAIDRELGPNHRKVRDAIEWCATGYGGRFVLSWEVARVAGVKRRTARFYLALLEREGVVECRPTLRRVADDRDHDGLEWRWIDPVTPVR